MIQLKKLISIHYIWKRLLSVLILGFLGFCLVATTVGLSGCSSDSSGLNAQGEQETTDGEIVIGLTDAEGDFVCYTVNVLSLTLTKAGGAVVETLPLSTRVDFTRFTEMTEFLTAATIPSGVYTKATMTLDYQDADIWVEGADGEAVKVDTIQDVNGNEIMTLEVSVHLEGKNSLLIRPGIPAHLTLDFDLGVSNKVEFEESGSPVLTVKPILLADVDPQEPKIHRLRGPLKKVSVNKGTFDVIIRPFIHVLSGGHDRFGALKVFTDDKTVYEIDGALYQGKEGLVALDAMTTFTATIVIGDLRFNPCRFEARQVYAGSSVPGGELDVVAGNVISRDDGDVVTMKGVTLIRAGGSVVFNDTVAVHLGNNTKVRRQLSKDEYNINDISVGQRVTVFGTLNHDETELDATDGYAHMLLTTLRGTVLDVDTPLFVINIQSIDRRHVSVFDFQGTGMDPDNDADPAYYEIDSGSLDLSSLAQASPVKVRGFVSPFGQAPEDFEAQTVIDVSNVKAVMTVNWDPVSTTAFENLSAQGLTLNLEGIGLFHHMGRAGVVTDLVMLSDSPFIQPREGGQGLFSITQNGTCQLHTTFENFVADLKDRLADGGAVKDLVATGLFDDGTATLTVGNVSVKLE